MTKATGEQMAKNEGYTPSSAGTLVYFPVEDTEANRLALFSRS